MKFLKNDIKIPYISSKWKKLFEPTINGNYVNDHSIVLGPDGKWHLFGITSFEGIPSQERYFVHGVGQSLDLPFEEVGRAIDRGTLAWAPGIIKKDENYYMFYGPSPSSLAVSFDMYEWFGTNIALNNEPLMGAHRDHFVLQVSEYEYYMYVVGVYNRRGAVSCFLSRDLINWEFKGFALTCGEESPLKPAWGAMESPFVVKKEGFYYLFVTYTDCSNETYNNTLVFCSENPEQFGEYNGEKSGTKPITVLQAHAPEIIEDNGKYYITTCGWRTKPTPHNGAVSVAMLEWE